jgi:uncharacterized protein (TIGR01244 family)
MWFFLSIIAAGTLGCSPGDTPAVEETAVVEATPVVEAAPTIEATAVEKLELPGIVNFSRINESAGVAGSLVGFGGSTEPPAMALLQEEGFISVINLRLASEEDVDVEGGRAAAQAAGLKYIHLPMDTKASDRSYVDEFFAAVEDPANQPVYVHCGSATRAGALWMIMRVIEDGWDIDAASEEARAIAKKPDEAVAFATAYLEAREE